MPLFKVMVSMVALVAGGLTVVVNLFLRGESFDVRTGVQRGFLIWYLGWGTLGEVAVLCSWK